MLSKIRKPQVQEVSAFDDIHANATFPEKEDPYAGKSFAEVLRLKREKLEADLKAQALPVQKSEVAEGGDSAAATDPPVDDDSLEGRKRRLQAQRQALLEKRKREREKELEDYN